jgi:ArsR family transcriptional regulator
LEVRVSELPKKTDIVAYCRGPYCVWAGEAVALLRDKGFQAVRLEDSVHDWRAHGLPVSAGDTP